jgi:tetratricopeptide (TPR) repeat protein
MRLQSSDSAQKAQDNQEVEGPEIEKLSENGNTQYLAQVLSARALLYSKQKRFEDALRDIEQAETCASEAYEHKQFLFEKFVLLLKLGRTSEALVQGKEAIKRYREALTPPNRQLQAQWKDVLRYLESLYTAMAQLLVEMNQPDHLQQALVMAEQGKAQILRQQLVWSGEQPDQAYIT